MRTLLSRWWRRLKSIFPPLWWRPIRRRQIVKAEHHLRAVANAATGDPKILGDDSVAPPMGRLEAPAEPEVVQRHRSKPEPDVPTDEEYVKSRFYHRHLSPEARRRKRVRRRLRLDSQRRNRKG